MSKDTSLLETMQIDAQGVMELAGKLLQEGAENAGHTLAALNLPDFSDRLDALYEEALDMRRPHLAVIVAVIDHVRGQLDDLLGSLALEFWVGEEQVNAAHEALDNLGEIFEQIVEALQTHARSD